jgi:hypothetical protein
VRSQELVMQTLAWGGVWESPECNGVGTMKEIPSHRECAWSKKSEPTLNV